MQRSLPTVLLVAMTNHKHVPFALGGTKCSCEELVPLQCGHLPQTVPKWHRLGQIT